MAGFLLTLRRSLLVPALLPVLVVVAGLSWAAVWLAAETLGAGADHVAQVRQGGLLFAAVLALSLAEPVAVAEDVGRGALLLRYRRTGGLGLLSRWLGLSAATLPFVLVAALAAGGLPAEPLRLCVQVLMLAAGGLALGAFLERARLVPALWALAVLGHLRPWISASGWGEGAAWLLPALATEAAGPGLLHGALWTAAALLVARSGLLARAGRS